MRGELQEPFHQADKIDHTRKGETAILCGRGNAQRVKSLCMELTTRPMFIFKLRIYENGFCVTCGIDEHRY